ncbi:MAG: nucleotidyltransferase family protein [Rhodoferax sp.]
MSSDQVNAIRRTAHRILGEGVRVRVFGSMARDDRRGGDIDLLFETDQALNNRAKTLCQLSGALTMALGNRKIDVLLKDADTPSAPIFEIARRTGVPL